MVVHGVAEADRIVVAEQPATDAGEDGQEACKACASGWLLSAEGHLTRERYNSCESELTNENQDEMVGDQGTVCPLTLQTRIQSFRCGHLKHLSRNYDPSRKKPVLGFIAKEMDGTEPESACGRISEGKF
jgi:hypothetical protein